VRHGLFLRRRGSLWSGPASIAGGDEGPRLADMGGGGTGIGCDEADPLAHRTPAARIAWQSGTGADHRSDALDGQFDDDVGARRKA